MRFVKDHHFGIGQQLRHATLFHRQVGKKQMVIDHHHIGSHGLSSGQSHMTRLELRALAAQAIFFGRGDHGNQGRSLIKPRQLAQVSFVGELGPLLHLAQQMNHKAVWEQALLFGQAQTVQTQIIGPTF